MDAVYEYAPMAGLIFFVIFFAGVLVYALRPSQKDKLQSYANIPFEEDDKNV